MPYAKAKAAAEIWLREQMAHFPFEVVVLRPGIVWGVRSPHTMQIAERLLDKSAFLVNEGNGIFNGIYIDNLVAAIRACAYTPWLSGFFNVGDAEQVTWREFYAALGEHLDCDVRELTNVSGSRFPWSIQAAVDYVQSLPGINALYHRFKAQLPDGAKSWIKSRLSGHVSYNRTADEYERVPVVDREMWCLQRVRNKPPIKKIGGQIGFMPPITFAAGIQKTVLWLKSLGYVQETTSAA